MFGLVLAAALAAAGQCGPQSPCWMDAVVNGKTVRVLGWLENGMVRFWPSQNTHLNPPAPAPKPELPTPTPTAMVGVTRDADGELNAGVDLRNVTPHAETLDTNDAEFGSNFFKRPAGNRQPDPAPPWEPSAPTPAPDGTQPLLIPGAIVAGAVLLGLFGLLRRQS